jgi:hypothetical protein
LLLSFGPLKVFSTSWKNGGLLSAALGMNLLSAATLPVSFCTSYTETGSCISINALILSGFASMPFVETRHPRTFPLWMPKTHFWRFNLRFAALRFANVSLDHWYDLFFGYFWRLCHPHMPECFSEVEDEGLLLSLSKMCILHSSAPLAFYETKCSEGCDETCLFFVFFAYSYLTIPWKHVQEWEHFTVGCIIYDFIYPF